MTFLRCLISRYFGSVWIPAALSLLLLGTAAALELAGPYRFAALSGGFAVAFLVSLLGVLCASLWNFIRKHWVRGLLNLLALPVCFAALLAVSFGTMFGPSEDGFADNLMIPAGLEISAPLPENQPAPGAAADTLQAALLAALEAAGDDDAKITASAPSLIKLAREHPALLLRYLASSAAWRVYPDGGKLFATRRWMIGNDWEMSLHGYYTRFSLGRWNKNETPDFQTRLTLGLDGKPWFENAATTRLKPGETRPLELREGNGKITSHCVVEADPLAIEIFEQSAGKERRLTKATLAELEKELAPLAANPTWDTARSLLPEGSVARGAPSLALRDGMQGGIYEATVRANPGEPGRIYLKAFEVTRGTPLSASRLKKDSAERIGWSDDPDEQFVSNTHIMIGEGDWEKYYAARFEVWFVPDSGTPERKLLERNFKIEGWQR